MSLSRVELYALIRRDRRLDPQVSLRELGRRYQVHWRTVRRALDSASPPERKPPVRSRPAVLEPAMEWIDVMLRADLSAPRKQRHTAKRIFERLRSEYGFDQVSYSTVSNYVAKRRPVIVAEARENGRHRPEGMVPQLHGPGEEAEVDFAEVWVRLAGQTVKCHLFTLRLSYSGKAVHRVFATQSQEAFMQGHVEAFDVLGGVPTRHIRYDNLKPAVKQVCFGRGRVESQKWVEFRSHYGFDAFYCLPGIDGAHEKGGVEHEGGRFRRTHLVPVVEVDTLTELNDRLVEIDRDEDSRHVHGSGTSIGFNFAVEADLLAPLPADRFEPGQTLTPTVRKNSRIVVRQCYYSVPARLIGRQVRVLLRANELLVFDLGIHPGSRPGAVVARHPRLTRRYDWRDDLDHFLEILLAKPGALAGSTALDQARKARKFTATHEAFWSAARQTHGDADGTRALIEVLLLHRRMPADAVVAGMQVALDAGSTSPDLVAIEARKANADQPTAHDGDTSTALGANANTELDAELAAQSGVESNTSVSDADAAVISLSERRPIPSDPRPLPSVAAYDQLLTHTSKGSA